MADNKQVFDIKTSKGAYPVAVGDEQSRNWTERQWDYQLQKEGATYDRTRTHLNFEIAKGGRIVPMGTNKKIGDRFKERCDELGIGDPNFKTDKDTGKLVPSNRVTTVWIQFSGSRELMHKLAFGNQKVNLEDGTDNSHIVRKRDIERWALAQYRFACEKWGKENIIGFNVHLDELNPHCHCTVMPVAMIKGKLNISFNQAFYTPKNMKDRLTTLHNELAVVNKPFGLERGDKVSETGAKHRTKEEYLRDKAQMEKAVKGLTTMVTHLTAERDKLHAELDTLKTKNEADADRYAKRILELQDQLRKIQGKLEAKQRMLDEKQSQLERMQRRINEAQAKAEKIEHAVHQAVNNSPAMMLAAKALIVEMAESICDVWNNTNTSRAEDDYMDESFVGGVLDHPIRIMKCAFFLFCGLVDEATTFAQTNGGGGGSQSDLPWRDKDEKDFEFMHRCMFHAHRMMKPKGGYSVKKGGKGLGK